MNNQKIDAETALCCVSLANSTRNATLIALAISRGDKVFDPDQPDTLIGYRLTLPENMTELAEKYKVHARKDDNMGKVIVAVGLRDNPNDPNFAG